MAYAMLTVLPVLTAFGTAFPETHKSELGNKQVV